MPSSVIRMMRYDPGQRSLYVVFRGGRGTYRYLDVPPEVWLAFRSAASKGTFLNQIFKSLGFAYTSLSAKEAAREIRQMNRVPDRDLVWGELTERPHSPAETT